MYLLFLELLQQVLSTHQQHTRNNFFFGSFILQRQHHVHIFQENWFSSYHHEWLFFRDAMVFPKKYGNHSWALYHTIPHPCSYQSKFPHYTIHSPKYDVLYATRVLCREWDALSSSIPTSLPSQWKPNCLCYHCQSQPCNTFLLTCIQSRINSSYGLVP